MSNDATYYLNPATLSLPEGLPDLRHNYQADGRHVFAGETDDALIWVQPKPHAWGKPGLYGTEKPSMQRPATANYGVNIQALAPHQGKVETNDPGFVPSFGVSNASSQVPLPQGGGPDAALPPGWVLPGALVVVVLGLAWVRSRANADHGHARVAATNHPQLLPPGAAREP